MSGLTRDNAFNNVLGEDYELLKFSYPHHDELQSMVAIQIHEHFASRNLDIIKVLEGGAGSGVTTTFLLSAEPKAHIYAIDSAKTMLDQAVTILSKEQRRVELIESDLLSYARKQPDQSFDAFVAVWTLHNLQPDYRSALFVEVRRILKPGGIFVSGDKYTVDNLAEHERQLQVQLQRFKAFPSENKAIIQAWVDHNLEDETIRISEKEQHAILDKLGFQNIKTVYRQDMEAIVTGVVTPGTP